MERAKRRFLTVLSIMLACAVYMPAGAEDRMYKDTLEYRGVTIQVDGFIQPEFPVPLKQITLAGANLRKETILNSLQSYFSIHPSSSFLGAEDYYVNFDSLTVNNRASYTPQYFLDFDQSYRIEDPTIAEYYHKCMLFLKELGIKGVRNVGYACYFRNRAIIPPEQFGDGPDDRLKILIPYDIDGLSTEYQCMIAGRGNVDCATPAASHIMDYPFASFTFDEQYQLVAANVSFYQTASEQPLTGEPIPWRQAVRSALDLEISERYYMPKEGWDVSPKDFFDYFFSTFTVRVIRVFPMWMPCWSNGCLPGWCVQLELTQRETGELFINIQFAVDARTGEVT